MQNETQLKVEQKRPKKIPLVPARISQLTKQLVLEIQTSTPAPEFDYKVIEDSVKAMHKKLVK